jgi:hypothetical protein
VLEELLAQRLFHAARRGAWYQRKALLEEHYMWALTPADGRSEEAQRKHWKRLALRTCEAGLEDPLCHLIFHYDLQKRITKLEKALRVVKREQHDFGHVMLGKPAERMIEGIRIDTGDSPRKGKATVWVDEREGGECRVESMCLSWYRDHGWKGYHSEGGIVRTLVSLIPCKAAFEYPEERADSDLQYSSATSSTISYSRMYLTYSKLRSRPVRSISTPMSSTRLVHRRSIIGLLRSRMGMQSGSSVRFMLERRRHSPALLGLTGLSI